MLIVELFFFFFEFAILIMRFDAFVRRFILSNVQFIIRKNNWHSSESFRHFFFTARKRRKVTARKRNKQCCCKDKCKLSFHQILLVFVYDTCFLGVVLEIYITYKEGYLVGRVEIVPEHIREFKDFRLCQRAWARPQSSAADCRRPCRCE